MLRFVCLCLVGGIWSVLAMYDERKNSTYSNSTYSNKSTSHSNGDSHTNETLYNTTCYWNKTWTERCAPDWNGKCVRKVAECRCISHPNKTYLDYSGDACRKSSGYYGFIDGGFEYCEQENCDAAQSDTHHDHRCEWKHYMSEKCYRNYYGKCEGKQDSYCPCPDGCEGYPEKGKIVPCDNCYDDVMMSQAAAVYGTQLAGIGVLFTLRGILL